MAEEVMTKQEVCANEPIRVLTRERRRRTGRISVVQLGGPVLLRQVDLDRVVRDHARTRTLAAEG